MSALLTIPQVINVGDVSTYLAYNNNAKGQLFGNRLATPVSPILIAMVTDAIRWEYAGDPTNSTLRETANYAMWLYGRYGLEAQYIISGSGGGTVIPDVPSNQPLPYQFKVTASSFIVDGQSAKTITNFTGYNLMFVRNNITQSVVNDGGSYYTWNRDTAEFECFPAAVDTELFQLFAV